MASAPEREAVSAAADWRALRGAIAGEVVLPDSPEYDLVRRPAIAQFGDLRPRAVVRCASPQDVVETISLARRRGLRTAVRSGGHCFAGRSSTEGILIDVTPMRSVSVSGALATVGAGARLGEVYDALADHGLTIAAGCGPSVGIAGLALGGGLGILGRKHGLTSDQLVAAQVVLANGHMVECDEHHRDDLFWALRGAGGGRFGVVTGLTLKTLPAPDATSFHLVWPDTHAGAVVDAWQAWAPRAPDELAASLLATAAAPVEQPPIIHLFGAMTGSEADTARLLHELVARAGSDPESASFRHMSYRETKRHLAEHGPGDDGGSSGPPAQAWHVLSKSEFFRRPLPAEAIAALLHNLRAARAPSQARELDFTPWGGAYNRERHDATAFVHRNELFLLKHGVVVDPAASADDRQRARDWLARSWQLAHPWGSGGVYPNFPDPDLEEWAPAYHGTNGDRLLRVKAKYDPGRLFGGEPAGDRAAAGSMNPLRRGVT
jgi:FAD/FMN-containing dehydrogenase